jgi:hypothetical protein
MDRPQLHYSALMMLSKCGEQLRRRYIEGDIVPPGIAAVVGTATHSSVRANLSEKIQSGRLLTPTDAMAIARDQLNEEWEKGVLINDEERSRGIKALRGEAVDKVVRLAGAHAERIAPILTPTHVERSWLIELRGFPMDLAGCIDIQEGSISVRDTKTSAKSPSADAADKSEQLTVYSMAVSVLDGAPPRSVALDYLVDLKRGTKVQCLVSHRTREDFEPVLRRVENAAYAIEKGVFVPARADDWWCSRTWCGYYDTCKYVRRR